MFTGIIEAQGLVQEVKWPVLKIQLPFPVPAIGASVAVNGVCLTVVKKQGQSMVVEVMEETLAVTNLKELQSGQQVNLERAMRADATLDGHLVQGHVEAAVKILSVEKRPNSHLIWLKAPKTLSPLLVDKGSVTLDGISLTIVEAKADGRFSVSIIPHTWEVTNLNKRGVGDLINIETDMMARLIQKQIKPYLAALALDKTRGQNSSRSISGAKRIRKA